MAEPEQSPFIPSDPEDKPQKPGLSRGEIILICLLCGVFVLLVAVATLQSDYSLATRLWLVTGVLVSAGFVVGAINYAIVSRRSFDEDYDKYLDARRKAAAEYPERVLALKANADQIGGNDQERDVRFQAAKKELDDALARADSLARDPDGNRQVISSTIIMNTVVFLVVGLIVVSFCTADDRCSWSSSMIWSIACVLLGGLTGFLFGIPRFRSEGKTPQTSGTRSTTTGTGATDSQPITGRAVATNDQSPIEQIADWLTKTIVGVALVNLKEMPTQLHRWASTIAGSVSTTKVRFNEWSAAGLITYFTIFGFLAGYLITQFFLQRYVNQQANG